MNIGGIGDKDPEDAYDATDAVAVRLAVLSRVAAAIETDPDGARQVRRRTDLVRLLRALSDHVANGGA